MFVCSCKSDSLETIEMISMMIFECVTCRPRGSLLGRCPFVGETDRATLLRVGEGILNWDAPDLTSRSPQAQDFLRQGSHPDPESGNPILCWGSLSKILFLIIIEEKTVF